MFFFDGMAFVSLLRATFFTPQSQEYQRVLDFSVQFDVSASEISIVSKKLGLF